MPRSVAVVVWRQGPEFLLLRRVPAKGGGWQPVTGRVEAGDGDLAAAAAREVEEETGCRPLAVVDLDLEAEFTGYDGNRYRERAFAAEVPRAAAVRLADEHDAHAWLAYAEARARLTWDENRRALDAAHRRAVHGDPGRP